MRYTNLFFLGFVINLAILYNAQAAIGSSPLTSANNPNTSDNKTLMQSFDQSTQTALNILKNTHYKDFNTEEESIENFNIFSSNSSDSFE